MGFDEILLTDVSYPTEGSWIRSTTTAPTGRRENLGCSWRRCAAALAEYDVTLSMELPPQVITQGSDDTAGLVSADIAPLVDRIYAVTTELTRSPRWQRRSVPPVRTRTSWRS